MKRFRWMAAVLLLAGACLTGCREPQNVPVAAPLNVCVSVCGQEWQVQSNGETVGQLLDRLEIALTGGFRASEDPDTPVMDGMTISVDLYETRMAVYTVPVQPDTRYCADPSLPEGKEEELFPGAPGQRELVVAVDCMNGTETGYELLEHSVTEWPQSRIVAVGTGERAGQSRSWPLYGENIIVLEDGQVLNYTHSGQFSATAYTSWVDGTVGTTATGTKARVGAIAVDPKVIPYGTKMFIVTNDGAYVYGIATAEDCGGAVKGNIVDLFFDTLAECYAFGRRNCTVYFLE